MGKNAVLVNKICTLSSIGIVRIDDRIFQLFNSKSVAYK